MLISICLGLAAFAAFSLFEFVRAGSLRTGSRYNIWFAVGLTLLTAMWVLIIIRGFRGIDVQFISGILIAAATVVWYVKLLAVAGKGNYTADKGSSEVNTEGIYGMCRHHGFYAFLILSGALALAAGTVEGVVCAALTVVLNSAYIIVQDVYWFRIYINGYEE